MNGGQELKCSNCGKRTMHHIRIVPKTRTRLLVCDMCLDAISMPAGETQLCFCLACRFPTNHIVTREGRQLTADCEVCGYSWVQYNHEAIDVSK